MQLRRRKLTCLAIACVLLSIYNFALLETHSLLDSSPLQWSFLPLNSISNDVVDKAGSEVVRDLNPVIVISAAEEARIFAARAGLQRRQPSKLKSFTILKTFQDAVISTSANMSFDRDRVLVQETIQGREEWVHIQTSGRTGSFRRREAIEHEVQRNYASGSEFGALPLPQIDRIYYINLERRHRRRALMEAWLKDPRYSLDIEYHRIPAIEGDPNTCVKNKNGPRCVGISGLIKTNLHILEHWNTTGMTLVLEDDFVVRDMAKLISSIRLVPPDWDTLRWDCFQKPLKQFERGYSYFRTGPLDPSECDSEEDCWYCGGTHTTLWRGGKSTEALKKVWSQKPYNGIDCLLTDPSLKSYCIQIGVGEFHHIEEEWTDIPREENTQP